jgi:hypothetical protein
MTTATHDSWQRGVSTETPRRVQQQLPRRHRPRWFGLSVGASDRRSNSDRGCGVPWVWQATVTDSVSRKIEAGQAHAQAAQLEEHSTTVFRPTFSEDYPAAGT